MGLIMLRKGLESESDTPNVRELDILLDEYREVPPGEIGMGGVELLNDRRPK